MNAARQLGLLNSFSGYHSELPQAWKSEDARYRYANEFYSWADGIVLHCMLRHLRPRRVVEVGSGFSSAVVLDTDDMFLGGSMACTFIDPYPERLRGLLKGSDLQRVRILETSVQEVAMEVFTNLQAGDVLLVDSSHVSKTGSDVNFILFEVLPQLASGVYIHFHDIFYPFEYPQSWVCEGVAWNEAYALHAFLQYNTTFSIEFFTSYLVQCEHEAFSRCLPLAMNSERDNPTLADAPGSSLWLRRC
jgi:hypothetical protein